MQTSVLFVVCVIYLLSAGPLWAMHESGHDLSDMEWLVARVRALTAT